jgi:hypothetical protein
MAQVPPIPVPGAVKTLGILNLAFAALGALGLVMTYATYFGGLELTHNDPVKRIALASPEYMNYLRVSLVFGVISSTVLAVSGSGLLRMRAWARKLTIGYAIYGILAGVGGIVMMQHYLLGPLSRSTDNPAVKGGAIGGLFGSVLALAYPIVLLVFMNKKNIRDAFTRANEPPLPPAQLR